MANTELAIIDPQQEQRLRLLSEYNPMEHIATWTANNKQSGGSQVVRYYPAAWRLYELSLKYPTANFSSEIIHMDPVKDFVIVKARLFLGADYGSSVKKAEAFKQGRLSDLDKVETKAKARCARDFGIGTEHALDMDDAVEGEVAGTIVNEVSVRPSQARQIEAPKNDPSIIIAKSANGTSGALYAAASKAKKQLIEAGADDAVWSAMLQDLGISEIANGQDIAKINAKVAELVKVAQQPAQAFVEEEPAPQAPATGEQLSQAISAAYDAAVQQEQIASPAQIKSIRSLCGSLGKPIPGGIGEMSVADAAALIKKFNDDLKAARQRAAKAS